MSGALSRSYPTRIKVPPWIIALRRRRIWLNDHPPRELQHSAPLTYRYENTIRVVVLENPHANISFPDVFRGPFDQRWTWQDGWCTPTWIGAAAQECLASGVPYHLL